MFHSLFIVNISCNKGLGAIKKINLRVRSANKLGIKLYKKVGFLEEGLLLMIPHREEQIKDYKLKFFDILQD